MPNLFGAPMQSPTFATPASSQQLELAKALIGAGAVARPVNTPIEGVARLGTSLVGALLGRQALKQQEARGQAYNKTLAEALNASAGSVPWVNPDTGMIAPGTSGSARMAQALLGNPDTAPLAAQLRFEEMQNQSKTAEQMAMQRYGKSLDKEFAPPIAVDGSLVDPNTFNPVYTGAPKQTDDQKEYEFAKTQGYTGTLQDWMTGMKRAGAPSTNVTVSGAKYGTIPQGYMLQETPQGAVMVPVPGGPAAREIDDKNKKEALSSQQRRVYADIVTQDVDRVIKMATDADFLPVTGMGGNILKNFAGTPAADAARLLDGVKANIGFDKLQQMRAASPTGGALGNVTEFENRLLQSVLGSLEQSQTKEQFLYNMNRLKDTYLDVIHGPGNRPEAGNPGAAAPPPISGTGAASQKPRLRYNPATQALE